MASFASRLVSSPLALFDKFQTINYSEKPCKPIYAAKT